MHKITIFFKSLPKIRIEIFWLSRDLLQNKNKALKLAYNMYMYIALVPSPALPLPPPPPLPSPPPLSPLPPLTCTTLLDSLLLLALIWYNVGLYKSTWLLRLPCKKKRSAIKWECQGAWPTLTLWMMNFPPKWERNWKLSCCYGNRMKGRSLSSRPLPASVLSLQCYPLPFPTVYEYY